MARLKADLRACYASHFAAVDPGVIGQLPNPAGTKISIGLAERYAPPDLWLQQEIAALSAADQGSQPAQPVDAPAGAEGASAAATYAEPKLRQERRRVPLEAWLSDTDREVVLGPAGSGKSTLLRFLALDMLSANPAFVTLRRLRPDFIAVWVSFPFWTQLIATDKDRSSLIETIESGAVLVAAQCRQFQFERHADLVQCDVGRHRTGAGRVIKRQHSLLRFGNWVRSTHKRHPRA